jgi:hypothetical protein
MGDEPFDVDPSRPRGLPASVTLLLGLVDLAVVVLLKSPIIGTPCRRTSCDSRERSVVLRSSSSPCTCRRSILLYDEAQKVPVAPAEAAGGYSTW